MSKYTIIYLWSENYSSGFDFFLLPDKVHLLQSYPILVQSMVQQLLRPWLLGYNHATQKHFKILSIFLNMELAYVSLKLFLLYMYMKKTNLYPGLSWLWCNSAVSFILHLLSLLFVNKMCSSEIYIFLLDQPAIIGQEAQLHNTVH